MANDTITLALSGNVPFDSFADGVSHLRRLVQALSEEIGTRSVIWYVHDLQVSSAVATIRGEAEDIAEVERVVSAYGEIGQALQEGRPIPYTPRVSEPAYQITHLVSDRIPYVRFETAEIDAMIYQAAQPSVPIVARTQPQRPSLGAVEGRVQSLTNRGSLRFTLFDTLHDRAVSCYLGVGQEELMREAWDKRAIVTGSITRDPDRGRPVAIRNIDAVKLLTNIEPGGYLRARGASLLRPGDHLPEETIRRLRDA